MHSIAAKIFLSLIPLLLLFACSSNKTVKETDVFEPDAAFKKANDLIPSSLESVQERDELVSSFLVGVSLPHDSG